jgi:MarR family 2-MHQ and catechol resistance regulon transcriptional repressor
MNATNNQSRLEELQTTIAAMRRAFISAREQLGTGLQLTRTQLEILSILGEGFEQTVSDLARRLFLTQSAVTQTVDSLVRRSLVERLPDASDRRIVRLVLSDEGRRLVGRVRELRQQHLQDLVAQLSPEELEALISAMRNVTAFIESFQETTTKT